DPMGSKTKAANFNLENTHGGDVSLSDFKGKFVLLNFWATWCAPCRKEMPAMSNLHNDFKDAGLEVVGVHVGPSLAGIKKFLEAVPVSFTILIDKDMSLASWGVQGLPTTFLINPDGKLTYKAVGEREWDSQEMVKFLQDQVTQYERMAETGQTDEPEMAVKIKKKSFFANFLEKTFGWSSDDACDISNPIAN
ncbi:MAG: TlpA disulfide reductase family protein, partial [Pseudomonadota bacterium]